MNEGDNFDPIEYFSNPKESAQKQYEVLRAYFLESLTQKEAADKMGISQPTFSRILESAHQKTTQALFEGKIIKIYGGSFDYRKSFVGYGCLDCNFEWEDETASTDRKVECEKCSSKNVYYLVREII